MPSFAWGRNQSLHYKIFYSYACILILIKLIDKVTDSITVNHELMPSSEEIIFKTVVASAGYLKGLIDERKYLTFVKITGLLKLFFKRISIKRAVFSTKSCTFEQAL